MIHLTHVGYYAGLPFCDIPEKDHSTDTFIHYAAWYGMTDEDILAHEDVCPNCKQYLREIIAEVDENGSMTRYARQEQDQLEEADYRYDLRKDEG